MERSRLSLKWLEIFQEVAATGSLSAAASAAGLSVSTVSQHLKSLEDELGATLLDHDRRPMTVTAEGATFLRHVDAALALLRRAEGELTIGAAAETRRLRLALIEDFDSEIAPALAGALARAMPRCAFTHHTRPSHEILAMLRAREIDIGVATRPQFDEPELIEHPLLRDPFVVAMPKGRGDSVEACLGGESGLPFLRYSDEQIIGAQIASQLRRLKVDPPGRFQFESNQSLMGMIAGGDGWAITTPTNFMRARRFHQSIELHPFPSKAFARSISLFRTEGHAEDAARVIAETLRRLIQTRAIAPAAELAPWLAGRFVLAEAEGPETARD